MSVVNSTILELSQQIAILNSENERLQKEIERQVLTKPKRPKRSKASETIECWARKLYDEKYDQLCEQFGDDISIIQKRFPRWKPKKAL